MAPGMDNAEGNKLPNREAAEGDVTLETVTLPTALKHFHAPRVIDFMSLDVEGGELLVLQGMEGFWDRYTFLSMLIERPGEQLHMMLIKQGYWFDRVLNSWGDILYIHPSTPGFAKRMAHERTIRSTRFKGGKAHEYLLLNASNSL